MAEVVGAWSFGARRPYLERGISKVRPACSNRAFAYIASCRAFLIAASIPIFSLTARTCAFCFGFN